MSLIPAHNKKWFTIHYVYFFSTIVLAVLIVIEGFTTILLRKEISTKKNSVYYDDIYRNYESLINSVTKEVISSDNRSPLGNIDI